MNLNVGVFFSFGDVFGLGFTRSEDSAWIGLGFFAVKWELGTGWQLLFLGKRV